jgi:uncharacterized protein (TIGR02646 family)
MKRVSKNDPPKSLIYYVSENPDATWDKMRYDKANDGYIALQDCRKYVLRDQCGLCAYCEEQIHLDDKSHCRIEHFHPKSDKSKYARAFAGALAASPGFAQRTT